MAEEFVEDIISAQPAEETPVEGAEPVEESKPAKDTQTDEPSAADKAPASETPSIEEIAAQLGWKPDHNGENFVDASTFILRSREIQDSMRDHNKDLKNQLSNLQGSVDALKEHNERVYKAEIAQKQQEIERLRKEKKAAIEMADVDKVEELDGEITTREKALSEPKPKAAPTTNPVYDAWVKDNAWYLTNDEMAAYADTVAQQYAGAPLERVYSIVRNKVAEVFPEQFEKAPASMEKPPNLKDVNSTKPKPVGPASPVEGDKKTGESPTFTKANLSPEQLSIMNQFVRSGIMTEDQYIKDLAKLQEA